jgi:hypothetical protein
MRRVIALGLFGIAAVAIAAVAWQEQRYLHLRRTVVQDRQALLYTGGTFHVLSFLQHASAHAPVAPEFVRPPAFADRDAALLSALRALKQAAELGGNARVVYAGKVAANALTSTQLATEFGDGAPWSAVVLTQHDSRASAEQVLASAPYRAALAKFEHHYTTGMRRSPWLNLGIPVVLLGKRIVQLATAEPSHFPFTPGETQLGLEAAAAALLAERAHGEHAVVVANLIREGSGAQSAADRRYTSQMFGLMAEGVHGPMHVGDAVPLAEGTRFDRVALVYYPGVAYFGDMLRSRFYRGIVSDKQLGDTQASITVPVLDRL